MQINTRRCMQCKGEMAMTALAPMAGEEQGVRMSIEGMPAMQCAEGHKRFIAPEFAVKMMEALLADGRLVPLEPAAEKGLLRTRLHCPGCGAELGDGARSRAAAKRTVAVKGLEAFGVQVELPKYRCAGCGKESAPPDKALTDGLMKASVQAFRAAQVTPT